MGTRRSPQLSSHRGAVGSNSLITGTTLVPGTAPGKGSDPSVPHTQKCCKFALFFPFFPSFHLHKEREKRDLSPSFWDQHSCEQRQLSRKISLQLRKG